MAEYNTNLWAPWRMEFIRSLADDGGDAGCFLCQYWSTPGSDEEHRVLWRGDRAFVCMNRFPYTNGHLLVASDEHVPTITRLSPECLHEMTSMLRDSVALLEKTLGSDGYNVGFNIGHCAGAGLPGHLHAHIVPRWTGDTNFMAVLGGTRMVPDSLDAMHRDLVKNAVDMGIIDE